MFKKQDPNFLADSANVVKQIEQVKLGTVKIADVTKSLEDFMGKYGDKEDSAYVTLKSLSDDSKAEFRIKLSDIMGSDSMKGKSMIDLLKE